MKHWIIRRQTLICLNLCIHLIFINMNMCKQTSRYQIYKSKLGPWKDKTFCIKRTRISYQRLKILHVPWYREYVILIYYYFLWYGSLRLWTTWRRFLSLLCRQYYQGERLQTKHDPCLFVDWYGLTPPCLPAHKAFF